MPTRASTAVDVGDPGAEAAERGPAEPSETEDRLALAPRRIRRAMGQVVQVIPGTVDGTARNSAVECDPTCSRRRIYREERTGCSAVARPAPGSSPGGRRAPLRTRPCASVEPPGTAMLKASVSPPGRWSGCAREQTRPGGPGLLGLICRADHDSPEFVRPPAARRSAGTAVRRVDGADRGRYRAHRRDRHRHPGLVGGGYRRSPPFSPARPAGTVAGFAARPAFLPAGARGARGQGP